MLTLSIDTSTARGSVALGDQQELRREIFLREADRPSTTLFDALAELEFRTEPLQRIVVGLGPGSFSGVRVGLAAAYGLAAVFQVPVWGLCSACSVAHQFPQVTRLGVFADAKRGEFYETIFAHGAWERGPSLLSATDLELEIGKVTLAVSAEKLPGLIERAWPRASDFLQVPEDSPFWKKETELEPIYLRTPVATAPSNS
jgi:tRNA threonylcarbamoyl adenosine modification protein YeaZ